MNLLKTDPFSGEKFKANRSNQKFASRENQIKYNNLMAKKRKVTSNLKQTAIHKNWEILNSLKGNLKSKHVSKDFLLGSGFDFEAFTNVVVSNKKRKYCIYNLSFQKIKNNNYVIK